MRPQSGRSERPGLRVVVDTNVWVSGLIVPDSPPGRVLEAVRQGELVAVASWELAEEIVDVLRRPKLRRYRVTEQDIRDLLFLLTPALPTVEMEVPIRDPDDAPVIGAAVASGAEAIVTGDRDLLEDPELRDWLRRRGIVLYTPAALLEGLAS